MNLKVSGVDSAPFNSALAGLHRAEQLLPTAHLSLLFYLTGRILPASQAGNREHTGCVCEHQNV